MKPALVLGLAFAAKAMTADNELGIKYVHLPSVPAPEHVAYDEVADDELGIAQQIIQLPPDHAFDDADDEFGIKYVTISDTGLVALDDADDEFLAVNQPQKPQKKPFEESKHAMLCRSHPEHPFCGGPKRPFVKPVEADDEFYTPVIVLDDAADDELSVMPVKPKTADIDLKKYKPTVMPYGWEKLPLYQNKPAVMPRSEALLRDDAADDELSIMPVKPKTTNIDLKKFPIYENRPAVMPHGWEKLPQYQKKPAVMPPVAFDDADDELFANGMRIQDIARDDVDDEFYTPVVVLDDAADDELFANGMRIQDIARDAEDDELMVVPHPMPYVNTFVRDDEADDELLYLGQIIRDGGYIPRPYFDDEFRAEKPEKSQEKTQKTEGPKNKRKLRPVVDEAAVYRN